jgi:hypothetical protein
MMQMKVAESLTRSDLLIDPWHLSGVQANPASLDAAVTTLDYLQISYNTGTFHLHALLAVSRAAPTSGYGSSLRPSL